MAYEFSPVNPIVWSAVALAALCTWAAVTWYHRRYPDQNDDDR